MTHSGMHWLCFHDQCASFGARCYHLVWKDPLFKHSLLCNIFAAWKVHLPCSCDVLIDLVEFTYNASSLSLHAAYLDGIVVTSIYWNHVRDSFTKMQHGRLYLETNPSHARISD
jgi:hypothetical protein